MAIKDLLSLFDAKLRDVFHKVEYDAAADRAKAVKRLTATKDKFLATEPPRGKKDFSIANGVVEWSPKTPSGGTLFEESPVYVPSERFNEAVEKTIALVNSGAFDKRLEGDDDASAPKAPKSTRKPRAPKAPGEAGRGWSDERRAKFAATVAARNAAKAG